ncbi:MAG TPA: tetratricopeptide repeat protein [Gemmatimonadaceae bacterium]|nr:tetratricopeptide repeat protein [Gemmatimonadaceae bacterium]
MSAQIAKLKKKAAEFEQKKQFDKALASYQQMFEGNTEGDEEIDGALCNRVGDLFLRQGTVGDAVTYYEKAVDLYAEGGFFNNAIALCNKILRHSPGRSSVYYKLGRISAKKGFKSDAKQNFLEYADRMQKAGQLDEAFRALKEFADLVPDQDDVRLMLAEQLAKMDRKGEALDQLQTLYEKFESEGRRAEARATVDRMKAIDPAAEPKAPGAPRQQKSADLVFLDVSWDDKAAGGAGKPPAKAPPRPSAPAPAQPTPDFNTSAAAAATRSPTPPKARTPARAPTPVDDLPLLIDPVREDEDRAAAAAASAEPGAAPLSGLEVNADFAAPQAGTPAAGSLALEGFETTSFGAEPPAVVDPLPLSGSEFGELRLETPIDSASIPTPEHDLALPGDLPLLDAGGAREEAPLGGDLEFIMPDDDRVAPPRGASAEAVPELLDLGAPSHGSAVDLPFLVDEPSMDAAGAGSLRPPADLPMMDLGADASTGPEFIDFDAVPAGSAGAGGDTGAGLELIQPDEELEEEVEEPEPAAPAPRRGSTSVLAQSVDMLRMRVADEPSNWGLRRQLAESLLEDGDREGGLQELEQVMIGFERGNDLESARSVANEIIRLEPDSVRHHQKKVEYAFRTNDKPRLVEAYLELANALFRTGQTDKSRAVYQRVLELSPDDVRAVAAISTLAGPDATPSSTPAVEQRPIAGSAGRRYSADRETPRDEPAVARSAAGDFVNLGDWLRDEQGPKSTRMVVAEEKPSGDEQADFNDMLRKFKQGIAENVDPEDYASHYDLGVAYKEMGLVDEAIAEFQTALRGPDRRVRVFEALGQCFMEKSQHHVASTILQRALNERDVTEDQLIGVLYLLGYAAEAMQKYDEAMIYYQRVFALDIQFRDVADRLNALEKAAR